MNDVLIDRIYECSFVPELWPSVLDDLAHVADSKGGILFTVKEKMLNWTSSANMKDIFQSYVTDGWFRHCDRRLCIFSAQDPGFHVEHDFWTDEQLDSKPIYRDFFRPNGLGWSAGTGISMPTGDNIAFSIERPLSRGPIEKELVHRLNDLRAHLARSAFVASRLGLQRARSANDTLAHLGLPALLLDETGIVMEANSLIEALPSILKWRAHSRITLCDSSANTMLLATLASLDADGNPSIRSFAVKDAEERASMVAHVIPIRRTAHDLFGRSFALLVLTPVSAQRAPPVDLIRSLFDLTASEARVARSLAVGETLDEIASTGGVAMSTVRSQLRQVLEKTGCTRQAEVVALLANVALNREIS